MEDGATLKRDDGGVSFFPQTVKGRVPFLLPVVTFVMLVENLCPAKRGAARMGSARTPVRTGGTSGEEDRRCNHYHHVVS